MERGGVEDGKGMGGQAGLVMVQERGKEVKSESPILSSTHTWKHPVLYHLASTTSTWFHSWNQSALCKCALTFTLTLTKIVLIQNDICFVLVYISEWVRVRACVLFALPSFLR